MPFQVLRRRSKLLFLQGLPPIKLPSRCWLIAALFVFDRVSALVPIASAQMDMTAQTMETQNETAPNELPTPHRMIGIGNAHMKVTATAEAQMWFDQGLNLLHDFWDYESARAFEQGVRADPKCAMCYWGLYKAESFYHSTAQGYAGQALARAVALKRRASKRERLFIEATVAEESAMNSRSSFTAAIDLCRKLVRQYQKDVEAKLLLAQLVDHPESVAILQSILKDKPDDSAANHYYIHAVESSQHPEQALHSAEILASLAPGSGHMVHMPGHILFRMGDYSRAEQAFLTSMRVDESYMQEQHVQPDNDWNYVHNLMYLTADLMEEGKLKQATALSAKISTARGKLESTLYIYSTRDSITRLDPSLPVALRTGDWDQAIRLLATASTLTGHPNLDFLAHQLDRFAAGMQAIEGRDLPKAEEQSLRFDAELWRKSQEAKPSPGMRRMSEKRAPSGTPPKLTVMPDALLQPLLNSLSIMSLELRASMMTAQGKTGEAKRLFLTATQQEEAMGYHEPPNYIRPVRETEGAAMIAAGDWADAKEAYKQALLERPRSGFSLYGIAIASEKSGDADAAAKEYGDFLAAWKNADPSLAQLTHAQAYLAEHGARGGVQEQQ